MLNIIRLITALLLVAVGAASAQSLTTAQVAVLRANILADPVLIAKCVPFGDGPFDIAVAYNLLKSPLFTVWRTRVTNDELGDAMNGTEVTGLTSIKLQSLQVLSAYSGGTQNMGRLDRRAAFDAVFSAAGGVITRASMLIVWKRPATRSEALFATGTGTDAVPGALVVEGALSLTDVQRACTL